MPTCAQKLVTLPRIHTLQKKTSLKKKTKNKDQKNAAPSPSGGTSGCSQVQPRVGEGPVPPLALLEVKHGVGKLQREIGEERDPELVKASLDMRVEHQGSVERRSEA